MIYLCPMNRYENYADLFDLCNSLLHTHYADVFDLRNSLLHTQPPIRATTRSGYMMTSPTFAKWRPRRETRGKVTSRLFAAPRSVFSPYYFESCDFRQWEIRGVKKKCRPMNVCAFLGGKTTEHESFSAQRNAGQGAKHLKKKGEFQFSDPWKNFFWNIDKICLLMVVFLV